MGVDVLNGEEVSIHRGQPRASSTLASGIRKRRTNTAGTRSLIPTIQ